MLKLLRNLKARYDRRQRELDEAWDLLYRARRGEIDLRVGDHHVLTWKR